MDREPPLARTNADTPKGDPSGVSTMADTDRLDAEAENPPKGPLAGAVLGLVLVAAGVLWALAGLAGVVAASALSQGLVLAVLGIVAFVGSMLWWSPELGTGT